MAASAFWKRYDTAPVLAVQLYGAGGASPLDLSAASQVRAIWQTTSAPTQVTGSGVMTIASSVGGYCTYQWQPSDLAVADIYNSEYEVLGNTASQVYTVPNQGYIPFQVIADLENK